MVRVRVRVRDRVRVKVRDRVRVWVRVGIQRQLAYTVKALLITNGNLHG